MSPNPPNPPASTQSGFSLIELLIGMVIAIEILVAALTVFDVHSRMARVQMQITDMQQSLRVAQYDMVRTTRMAGRGGLQPNFSVDNVTLTVPWLRGDSVEVRDNVATGDDQDVALGTDEPKALAGTDILTVRGCISGLQFQMDSTNPADYTPPALVLRKRVALGREQDLAEFLAPGFSGLIVLQSSADRNQYAVAEVASAAGTVDLVTLTITFVSATGNPIVRPPGNPLFVPGFACVLEEYRYYVRGTVGDDIVPLKPRLARARMIPGTELPFAGDAANLTLDIADDIFDLQVALGFDTDYDSVASGVGSFDDDPDALGPDDVLYEGADDDARATDDWLGNSSSDDPTAAQYRVNAAIPGRPVKLLSVRVSTLARAARPDSKYTAPDFDPVAGVDFIENNDYDSAPASLFKTPANRQFRHRLLQTVVEVRNLN